MSYCIIDQPQDVALLARIVVKPDSVLVPISAVAHCRMPRDWPEARVVRLDALIRPNDLAAEVARRRQSIRELFDRLPACPFYKTHQLIDVFLEKQVIVDLLAGLPGDKYFIDQQSGWVAVDGDNSEGLRLAALYMRGTEGFHCIATERMRSVGQRLRLVGRHLRATVAELRKRPRDDARFGTGELGYGSREHFADAGAVALTPARLIAETLRHGGRGWLDALRLLLHDQPISLESVVAASRTHSYVDVLNLLQRRSANVTRIAARYLARWRKLDFYFTVNYGPVLQVAVARVMRELGVPVVSMQHALMGHDRWSASQYVDTWLSDAKIVSSPEVARSMREFERPTGCAMIHVRLPMLRRKLKPVAWSGRSILYVLTGFTRVNTMYDNRRVNDALYFDLVDHKLARLAQAFDVHIRSHPYDARQYQDNISGLLASRNGARLYPGPIDQLDAAILIDSPSTILADALFAGRPVFVINETATLQPPFLTLARECHVTFETVEELMSYLAATAPADVKLAQESFATRFADLYFGDNTQSLMEAVDGWRLSRKATTQAGESMNGEPAGSMQRMQ